MKRLFIFLAAAIMAVSVMAEGHMKFKGVEIDGTKDQFVSLLSKGGCSINRDSNKEYIIKTDFAGSDMYVYPLVTSQTKIVYAVVASTGYIYDVASYLAQYNFLKELMTKKYGQGNFINLQDGYYATNTGTFERGRVSRATYFSTQEGLIVLYMHMDADHANVVVEYIDNENHSIRIKEANDDI